MTDHALPDLRRRLDADGHIFAPRAVMKAHLPKTFAGGWPALAAAWNDLGPDRFMADGGRYRKRRHAVFSLSRGVFTREAHQPHYQSRDYNLLNGGVQRWFDPVTPETAANPAFTALLDLCRDLFLDGADLTADWRVEIHQFRIEPAPGETGQPTPEGMHRDGVDWVAVILIDRLNVGEGVTAICGPGRQPLGAFTLTDPLDAVFLDDHRVLHGVTPIHRLSPAQPGHRDVLVVTFQRLTSSAVK
ncbi:2OG-Fe dioxygenase family protein [Asticcacaulis sp.]|uniref:2OG-Fe dioxygenase family protein n=1 Tax=Asticcacaulis sp. TaxID=1872648 RepID=UPI002CCBFFF7|nr:2OG-Fe dioxygenase family protein [Asticcacaulis sp.]HTM81983.1 2OG-Fe dioxygenase family protein [Asticcacaulis sp.]